MLIDYINGELSVEMNTLIENTCMSVLYAGMMLKKQIRL
jgi:hypothetical protein